MANLASSRTDPYAANVITHLIPAKKEGTLMLCKYDKSDGTRVDITITFVPKATLGIESDEYKPVFLSADGITLAPQTYRLDGSGNYVVPISVPQYAKSIKATAAFTGGASQTLVIDFMDE